MAREELSIGIKAEDKASPVIDKVAKKTEKLEDVTVKVKGDTGDAERDIDGLLSKVDKLGAGEAANLLLTSNASQIMNEIVDLTIKLDGLDASDPTVDVTVANIQQLQGDLDAVAAKAKEINGTPIKLDTSGAKQGMDDIAKSADSSKSVLANMVGNATQDLGALGGIAGSTGVAIGQMGEYMTDALGAGDKLGTVLGNFATVAGPITVIALTLQGVNAVMDAFSDSSERTSENVDDMSESMRDGADAAEAYSQRIQELGEVTLDNVRAQSKLTTVLDKSVGSWAVLGPATTALFKAFADGKDDTENMTGALVDAGINLQEWTNFVSRGTTGAAELRAALADTSLSADEQKDVMAALGQAQEDVGTAALSAGEAEAFFGSSLDETAKAAEEHARLVELNNQKMDEHRQKLREQDDAYKLASAGLAQAIDDANAFAAALDGLNATKDLDFSTMALGTVDSFDSMKEAIEGAEKKAGDWSKVDLTPDSVEELKGIPDELAAVTEGLSGMRDTIQTELNAAFETGGIDAYTAKAEFFRTQVLDQFPQAFRDAGAGAAEAQAQAEALASELGLMPEDIQIMIQLTRAEEARAALDQFADFIANDIPQNVEVAIKTAISQGDLDTAFTLLNTQLQQMGYAPIVLPTDADIAGATGKIDEAKTYGDSATATMGLEANPDPALGAIGDVEGGQYSATIDADANTSTAQTGIAAVEEAPHNTTIDADADTQKAARQLLDETTRQRNATIYAVADANAAAGRLDAVADDRTAHIYAVAHTGGAEAALNSAARSRTATIVAHTVNVSSASVQTAGVGVDARAATASPVYAPNITINTAVLGDPYAVQRTVMRAVRSGIRLSGARHARTEARQ